MNIKMKLFLLILINSISISSLALEKYNSELVVSGTEALERVEWTVVPPLLNPEDKYVQNGDTSITHAVWADEGATVENIGKIYSERERYDTQVGGILFDIINNKLKKQDDLVVLRGNTTGGKSTRLENYGVIDMGMLYHRVDIILSALDLSFFNKYAEYEKNVLNSVNSEIYNEGTIKSRGDKLRYNTEVEIGLLQYNEVNYNKNIVNMTRGSLLNKGLIEYDRDRNVETVSFVGVDLVGLGLHYNRYTNGIQGNESTIVNDTNGRIFIGGDILEDRDYGGVDLNVIGADLVGVHHKYGINAVGGVVKNMGTIEVERDFSKVIDRHNNIVDINLIYGGSEFLGLGVLAFNNMDERSIGVSIENGSFYNDGGTIKVGANNKQLITQILDSKAVGVFAKDSNVYFNIDEKGNIGTGKTSLISLEGQGVYATYLDGSSNAYFDGTTNIEYKIPNGIKEDKLDEYISEINKNIFARGEGATGGYYIKGDVNVGGDLLIKNDDNIIIDTDGKVKNETGVETDKIWGKINSTGKIELSGNVNINTKKLLSLSDEELKKYEGIEILSSNKGITGEGNLVSDSAMFNISTDKTSQSNTVGITSINRVKFNELVTDRILADILEDSYIGCKGDTLEFYKYISEGKNYNSFNQRLNEATGIDNITTLTAQIFDISKDLNRKYKNFVKYNTGEGIIFNYLDSKSELEKKGDYQGFERKSSGIMTGYNKYILDNTRLGLGFSYMKSDIDYSSKSFNEVETWNFRGYLNKDFDKFSLYNDISFGYNKSKNERYIDEKENKGNVNIYNFSINNVLYKKYRLSEKIKVSPSLGLELNYIYQDNFEEEGVFASSFEKVDGMYANLGTSLDMKYDLYSDKNIKISLNGGMDLSYDIYQDVDETKFKILDHNQAISRENKELDKESFVCRVGINLNYDEVYNIGLDYSKEMINDVDNDKIGLSFSYRF